MSKAELEAREYKKAKRLPMGNTAPKITAQAKENGRGEFIEMEVLGDEAAEDAQTQLASDETKPQEQDAAVDKNTRYANTLLPIVVPKDYPDINFRPLILDPQFLIAFLIFNITCLSSVVIVLYCADHNHQYHTTYSNIHLVIRYIPTTAGTITTVLFRSVRDTFCRIQPYISMADQKCIRECRGSKSVGQLYMRGIRINERGTWTKESRHSLRVILTISNLLIVQMAGYKASLFSTAYSGEGWLITVHYQIVWVIFVLYLLVVFLCTLMLWKMWRAKTGLKWDPVRIVDILALFHGSNILGDFEELERWPHKTASELLKDKTYRLGYWEKGTNKDIWYGIGRANPGSAASSEISSVHSNLNVHSPAETVQDAETHATHPGEDCSNGNSTFNHCSETVQNECIEKAHCPLCGHVSYRDSTYPWDRASFLPWTISVWIPFIFGLLGLLIYAVATAKVQNGFSISSQTPYTNSSTPSPFTFNITTSGGDIFFANFDPGNGILWVLFYWRTILVIYSSYMAIAWFGFVDNSIRFSQPFHNMNNKAATAEDSILLDYFWGISGLTTIKALMSKHWLVAWFSLLSLFAPAFPILVGGLFVITNAGDRIYFSITPVTFYLVSTYFIIYAISLPLSWPRRDRRLLRYHDSIADYVSLFYASNLLHDPDSKLDISAPNVTQRHLDSRVFLEEKKYSIGLYRGVDAKCHFGLDVATLDRGAGEAPHVFFVPYDTWYWKEHTMRKEVLKKIVRMHGIGTRRAKRRQIRKLNENDAV